MTARPVSSSERGAATVEFAVSAIVLFTLIFGCVGLAMAYYTYEVINQYARDASRYAITHGGGCNSPINGVCSIGTGDMANLALKTYLNTETYPGINGANIAVSTTYTHAPGATTCNTFLCDGPGDQVTVTVTYPYLYSVPFVPSNSFTMHGASTMIIAQ